MVCRKACDVNVGVGVFRQLSLPGSWHRNSILVRVCVFEHCEQLNSLSFTHIILQPFLFQRRFVHRDLATRNVLVATPQIVKISDFGFTRAVNKDDIYTVGCM